MPYFLGQQEIARPEEVTAESAILGLNSQSTWKHERDIHVMVQSHGTRLGRSGRQQAAM
jgi:hypothetical protein